MTLLGTQGSFVADAPQDDMVVTRLLLTINWTRPYTPLDDQLLTVNWTARWTSSTLPT
jgi:hypothetical protein